MSFMVLVYDGLNPDSRRGLSEPARFAQVVNEHHVGEVRPGVLSGLRLNRLCLFGEELFVSHGLELVAKRILPGACQREFEFVDVFHL